MALTQLSDMRIVKIAYSSILVKTLKLEKIVEKLMTIL